MFFSKRIPGSWQVFLSVTLLVLFYAASAMAIDYIKAGETLPDTLQVSDYQGKTVKLAEAVKGKKSMIIFFNTSCRQCLAETRYLMDNYGDENNIFVAIDMAGADLVEKWQKKRLADYPEINILLDPEFKTPMQFGLSLTPSSVYINADGTVAQVKPGYNKSSESVIDTFYK